MRNVVGIVNLHDCPHLGPLTMSRPLGTTSFLGRYGLMDFTLSNFSNSGIDRVAVLAETDFHSVINHLQTGQVWINNTRLGFQRVLTNESLLGVSKFNTDIQNMIVNKGLFYDENPEYVIIAPAFMLMSYNYRELLKKHIETGADVTILTKHISNNTDREFYNCDVLEVGEEDKVVGVSTNTCRRKEVDISLESFIFKADSLVNIISEAKDISKLFSLRKLINYFIELGKYDIRAAFFDGCVLPILSFEHYVRHSFNLLKVEEREKLFKDDWPIYTTTHNTPPALYGEHAIVSNSFIANGCIIKGRVKNSIISRDVIIGEGASVEDSIIFTKSEIGQNIKIKYVVTDKRAKVVEIKKISGEKGDMLYIGREERV